tara:strand:+ start:732 stop:1166 length:435 start_codon:yes stop_codon:yes gene_type:complete
MIEHNIIEKCNLLGLKMTDQRKIIIQVIADSKDHPDVELVFKRAFKIDKRISIATVYRTIRLFQEHGIIEKHEFGGSRSRYEKATHAHHDHLIDIKSGKVLEFQNDEIEELQKKIASKLGYELIEHRLELYAVPKGCASFGKDK